MNSPSPRRLFHNSTQLLGAFLVLLVSCVAIFPAEFNDNQQKAGVMCTLAKYISWPSALTNQPGAKFRIGILGKDPFGADLDLIVANQMIAGLPIEVLRGSKSEELIQCQVVFVSTLEISRMEQITESFQNKAILTVGDHPKFIERGGSVKLTVEGKRIVFDINREPTRSTGIEFRSKLLQLAKSVK